MLDNIPQITTKYREYVSINSFIQDGTSLVMKDIGHTVLENVDKVYRVNIFSHGNNFNIFQEVEDSKGVKECKDMQGYLIDAGVPVNLDTLYRSCSCKVTTILCDVTVVIDI